MSQLLSRHHGCTAALIATALMLATRCCHVNASDGSGPMGFYGVMPGVTGYDELVENEALEGHFDEKIIGGSVVSRQYKFGIWQNVFVSIDQGTVSGVDASPPERSRAEELAKVLGLGELRVVESSEFPPSADVGPDPDPSWKVFGFETPNVLFFVTSDSGKRYVQRMRLFDRSAIDSNRDSVVPDAQLMEASKALTPLTTSEPKATSADPTSQVTPEYSFDPIRSKLNGPTNRMK